ncbi:MAG: gamma-glutamyltransferase family protein [Chloroflexi bacterium]|nr:gamma-glutamyltransferase family protein [Chloroflexota bacterium]
MTLGFPGPLDAATAASSDRRRISPVMARGGIIGAQHPLVSSTGLRVLAEGGNAVDAAVAAALVATVVMPGRCGVGGDLFAIVSPASATGAAGNGDLLAFHGSGIAPRGASLEFMREHGQDSASGRRVMPQDGPLSPSVPGFIDGCFQLLERFGTRPFAELAVPAILYAEEGIVVSPAEHLAIVNNAERLGRYPASAAVFLPGGKPPRPGDILRQPNLARSLSLIARGGADAFYRGEIAKGITSFLAANGGALTTDDFADHTTDVSPPLATTYRGYTVYETGLPTQGLVVLEALNICEQAPLKEMGLRSASAVHTEVSALRLAFADRLAYAGDPDYVDTPVSKLISKEWAAERYATIDPQFASTIDAGKIAGGDTTNLAVIDENGLMISLIFTLSDIYGSAVVAGDTGILLTNRAGNCFELEDGHPNIYAPGKRTMHTLNCYLIADQTGTPILVGGTLGGDFQPQWNLQTITGLIDGGLDVQAAVEQPRWQLYPATYPAMLGDPFLLSIEDRLGEETIASLEEMGYPVQRIGAWGSGGAVQAIARDPETGILAGGSDPRAEGMAVGL